MPHYTNLKQNPSHRVLLHLPRESSVWCCQITPQGFFSTFEHSTPPRVPDPVKGDVHPGILSNPNLLCKRALKEERVFLSDQMVEDLLGMLTSILYLKPVSETQDCWKCGGTLFSVLVYNKIRDKCSDERIRKHPCM